MVTYIYVLYIYIIYIHIYMYTYVSYVYIYYIYMYKFVYVYMQMYNIVGICWYIPVYIICWHNYHTNLYHMYYIKIGPCLKSVVTWKQIFPATESKAYLVLYFHCLLFLELTRMIPIRRKKQRGIYVYTFKQYRWNLNCPTNLNRKYHAEYFSAYSIENTELVELNLYWSNVWILKNAWDYKCS